MAASESYQAISSWLSRSITIFNNSRWGLNHSIRATVVCFQCKLNQRHPRYFANRKRPRVPPPPWMFAFPSENWKCWKKFSWVCFRGRGIQRRWWKNSIFIGRPENQGQTPLCDFFHLRLQTWYKPDLGVDSNIFDVEDVEYVDKNHATLIEVICWKTWFLCEIAELYLL